MFKKEKGITLVALAVPKINARTVSVSVTARLG